MSKETSAAKRTGRPSKYKPEYCEAIVAAAKKGDTFEMFACDLGVHIDTLHEWAKVHPEFGYAKKLAKQHMVVGMQKLGFAAMNGKVPGFRDAMWIFWMKACHGWSESGPMDQDDEHELEFEEPKGTTA